MFMLCLNDIKWVIINYGQKTNMMMKEQQNRCYMNSKIKELKNDGQKEKR